jgi:ligand-binding sensor domain-containing protein
MFLFSDVHLFAQNFTYKHFSVREGLTSNTVYSIMVDRKGLLWFGTLNGVCYFNGNDFTKITSADGLSDNEVFLIKEDWNERVWFIAFGNKLSYYERGKLYSSKNTPYLATPIKSPDISHVFIDRDSSIYLVGGRIFKITKNSITDFSFGKNDLRYFYRNHKNELVALSENGLMKLEDSKWKMVTPVSPSLANFNRCSKIGDRVYYYQNHIFHQFQLQNDKLNFIRSYEMPSRINQIKSDSDHNVWILTNGSGAYKIDARTSDTLVFLPNKSVTDVARDKEGNYWFATTDDGVYQIHFPFIKYFNKTLGGGPLFVYSICATSEGVFAGLNNGYLAHINGNDFHIFKPIADNTTRMVSLLNHNDKLYYGSDVSIGFFLKNNFNKGKSILNGQYLIGSTKELLLHQDTLWIAGSGAITTMDTNLTSIKRRVSNRSTTLLFTDNNQLLSGNLDGLFRVVDTVLIPYKSDLSALQDKINFLTKDSSGNLYVASQNSGLIIFKKDTVIHLNSSSNFPANNCRHVTFDKEHCIWVATGSGLIRLVEKETNRYYSELLTTADGLPSDEINQTSYYNDTLWIATAEGIAGLRISQIKNHLSPSVFITGIRTNDSLYSSNAVISLPYRENSFTIYFGSINYSGGKPLQFKYSVNNQLYDKVLLKNDELQFFKLRPGTYEIKVFGVNDKGLSSKIPASINVIIQPPLWQTWWFQTAAGVFIVFLIIIIYKSQNEKIKKRMEMNQLLARSEIKALRAQMNPHFIFNSLNSIQNYIFDNQKVKANEYLVEFANLIRKILNNSEQGIISIGEEIDFLKSYVSLEQMRLKNKFSFEIVTDLEVSLSDKVIPSMLIQPFVENAIIHGIAPKTGPSNLIIRFKQNSCLVVEIEDNGIGTKAAQLNAENSPHHLHSFALHAIHDRMKAMNKIYNANIWFEIQELNSGATFPGTKVSIYLQDFN